MKRLLPLILCVGCASTQPTTTYRNPAETLPQKITKTVCIDKAFDEEDRLNILDGLNAWKKALNGGFEFSEGVSDCDWKILSAGPDNQFAAMHTMALAYTTEELGMINVFRGRIHGQAKFKTVIQHEIGHLFLVSHGPGLMAARYSPYFGETCVDEYAAEEACKFNALGNCDNTNPCIKE
jgi:hypothetical protein